MSAPVDSTSLAEQMRGLIWTAPEDRDLPVVESRLASKSLGPERIERNDEVVRRAWKFPVPGVDARVVPRAHNEFGTRRVPVTALTTRPKAVLQGQI